MLKKFMRYSIHMMWREVENCIKQEQDMIVQFNGEFPIIMQWNPLQEFKEDENSIRISYKNWKNRTIHHFGEWLNDRLESTLH